MLTCTWAPTTFQGTQIVSNRDSGGPMPTGDALLSTVTGYVQHVERLGISHLLIAQRWWGSGREIEGSSLDCLAMTAFFAAHTSKLKLITAIHPGFFQPAAIAKWGASLDRLTSGRWAINLTSGWNLKEFAMYGVDPLEHDERYDRSAEFLEVLTGAWTQTPFSYAGRYYQVTDLQLEPRPEHPLTVYQGGQSPAALNLAAQHSDWMFLNGGHPDRIAALIERARNAYAQAGRTPRFALYAAPLCRESDAAAWAEIDTLLAAVDPTLVAARQASVAGAQGMWADTEDPLSPLDTNEGYASRLIGSPATVLAQCRAYQAMGIDMLHLDIRDKLFTTEVLPQLHAL